MNPFELKLTFDGCMLRIDYCDGSDKETRVCPTLEKLKAEIMEAVITATSPEN